MLQVEQLCRIKFPTNATVHKLKQFLAENLVPSTGTSRKSNKLEVESIKIDGNKLKESRVEFVEDWGDAEEIGTPGQLRIRYTPEGNWYDTHTRTCTTQSSPGNLNRYEGKVIAITNDTVTAKFSDGTTETFRTSENRTYFMPVRLPVENVM